MICNAHQDRLDDLRSCPACDADAATEVLGEWIEMNTAAQKTIEAQAREIRTLQAALDRANRVPTAVPGAAKRTTKGV